jgi:hypothetical protein
MAVPVGAATLREAVTHQALPKQKNRNRQGN